MDELTKILQENGAYLHHVGMLSMDNDETEKELEKMLGLGTWERDSSVWTEENMVVGPANTIRCSNAKFWGSEVGLELVQPIHGKAEGTHFEEYLAKNGTGLHHVCYMFKRHEDFLRAHKEMVARGAVDVHHGQLTYDSGKLFVDFCYLEIIKDGLYLELNVVLPEE